MTFEELMEAARKMGEAHRRSLIEMAREVGLKEVPGCVIYVNGEKRIIPPIPVDDEEP